MDALVSARKRLSVSFVVGVVAASVMAWLAAWEVTVLIAWSAGAATFLGLTWGAVGWADEVRTRAIAQRADETRFSADLIMLTCCLVSLVGVAFILLKAERASGATLAALTGLGVVSIVLAWALVHTVYTLRYADLYYVQGGGIDFSEEKPPDYRDFAYLAFTIGMTYQVSDTAFQSKPVRRMALRHAMLSYVFGTAIIAVAINAVAGIAH
jgi:uncharacterized membrane protein